MNYKMMGKFLSQILIVEAGFMVPALLISLYTGSRAAVYGFGLSILITAGVGALMYYFCRNSTRRFFAREGMVCVAGSWIAISFFGCLPFVFSREIPNFVDALFDGDDLAHCAAGGVFDLAIFEIVDWHLALDEF